MRLGRLGEFGAIARIKSLCRRPGRGVRVGIGDDAAVLKPFGGLTLASCDMMVEGVHFDLGYTGFAELGYRALASNLSDIAAMGGRPAYYLVSAALSKDDDERSLEELCRGLEGAAAPFGVRLIGGDTTATPGPRAISVTILGEAAPGGPVRRSGARPGDDIYVTGTLGDSAAGLELLKSGAGGRRTGERVGEGCPEDASSYLISRHLMPKPRVRAGMMLSGVAGSMIDVSDGLSSDLGHILDASGVGAKIMAAQLPVSAQLIEYAGRRRSQRLALNGGEDYELLFTARPSRREKIRAIALEAGVAITLVGETTAGKGVYLVAGKGSVMQLKPGGYEHFSK